MTKITLEMFKNMKADEKFASGEFLYDGLIKKWLAVKSRTGWMDWAIYYGEPTDSLDHIRNWGTKLHDLSEIKKLINCEEEVLKLYRH